MNELPGVDESQITELVPEDPKISCKKKFTTSFETHALQNSKETIPTVQKQRFTSIQQEDLKLEESIPESFGKDLADFNLSLSMTGKLDQIAAKLAEEPPKQIHKEDILVETFGKVE